MSELPVVSQPPHRCAALLDFLARRLRVAAETSLTPLGLRARHLIAMTMLRDNPGLGQRSLAELLHIDPTNLVAVLNELEREGLIERQRSEQDRRRHVVALTPAGHEKLAEAEFALASTESEILVALTATEREALYQLLLSATRGLTIDSASV